MYGHPLLVVEQARAFAPGFFAPVVRIEFWRVQRELRWAVSRGARGVRFAELRRLLGARAALRAASFGWAVVGVPQNVQVKSSVESHFGTAGGVSGGSL